MGQTNEAEPSYRLAQMQTVNYFVPGWLLPLMVNDDASALTDAETDLGRRFLSDAVNEYGPGHWTVADEQYNDFGYNEVDAYLGVVWVATYHYEQRDAVVFVDPEPSTPTKCAASITRQSDGSWTAVVKMDGFIEQVVNSYSSEFTPNEIKADLRKTIKLWVAEGRYSGVTSFYFAQL